MAQPFFGRRDPDPGLLRSGSAAHPSSGANAPTATLPSALQGSAAALSNTAVSSTAPSGGSKLTVGPNIKLKGLEITDCDTLVVEGTVEATMNSRLMQIAEQGAFSGAAEIDIAEIHGRFDGDLTVRQKLVIHATGRVVGKIRYGKIVIEEGGQISGEVEVISTAARPAPVTGLKTGLQPA